MINQMEILSEIPILLSLYLLFIADKIVKY